MNGKVKEIPIRLPSWVNSLNGIRNPETHLPLPFTKCLVMRLIYKASPLLLSCEPAQMMHKFKSLAYLQFENYFKSIISQQVHEMVVHNRTLGRLRNSRNPSRKLFIVLKKQSQNFICLHHLFPTLVAY